MTGVLAKKAEAKIVTRWQFENMSVIAQNGLAFLERVGEKREREE